MIDETADGREVSGCFLGEYVPQDRIHLLRRRLFRQRPDLAPRQGGLHHSLGVRPLLGERPGLLHEGRDLLVRGAAGLQLFYQLRNEVDGRPDERDHRIRALDGTGEKPV